MRPTIRDVAQHAGVSIATVSRVMRDSQAVTAGTRERVTAAVAALEFTPSQLGRQLAERRHAANGIVFPDLAGPYYAEVVLGYETVAAQLGRSVLILSTQGRTAAPVMVQEMAGRCDGLVILGRTVPDDVVDRLVARGVPLVLLARPPREGCDSVNAEGAESARALTRHVVAQGARHVAFVGDPATSPDVARRWEGVSEVVAGADGVRLDLLPVHDLDEQDGADLVAGLMGRGAPLPDALMFANDELALGALTTLRDAGVDVPGQTMVTGWDDVMAARYAGLTTVRQPMRELGATAARLLDERLAGTRTTARHELLDTVLVERATTRRTPAARPAPTP